MITYENVNGFVVKYVITYDFIAEKINLFVVGYFNVFII